MAVDAAELTVARARAEIESGALSPVELTDAVLERISERNHELNAYLYVDEEGARAQARSASVVRISARQIPYIQSTAAAKISPIHGCQNRAVGPPPTSSESQKR